MDNHYNPARASFPAGSRARKQWEPEEETLLLQLRQQNPRVTWERMQHIFNSNVHASRHRSPDALACKHKSIVPKDVPSRSIPPSQEIIASEPSRQQGQVASTWNGTLGLVNEGQSVMGLGIHTLIDGELDWLAYADGLVDTDGYFSYVWEAQENLAAMCAGATAAAAGGLLAHSPILEVGPFTYPSELIAAQIEVVNRGRE